MGDAHTIAEAEEARQAGIRILRVQWLHGINVITHPNHGFKSEDFVGRISDLAVACSQNYLEQMVLPRFFMGLLWLLKYVHIVRFFLHHSFHFHPMINDLS